MTFEIYSCMDYYYYLFMPKYKLEGTREIRNFRSNIISYLYMNP